MSSVWVRLALLGALASGWGCPATPVPQPPAPDQGAVALATKRVSVIEGFRSDVHGVSALSHSVESGPGWVRVRWYVLHPRGLTATPTAEHEQGQLRLRASLTGVEAVVGGSDLVTYETELHQLPAGHLHITGPHRLDRTVDVTR